MKVEGPNPLRTGQVRRKSGSDAAGGDFASELEGAGAPASSGGVSGASGTSLIGSILALQQSEGEEGDAAKERAKSRAQELLRELELLRLDILSGVIPRGHLIALAQTIKTSREGVFDPRLTEILDEIDLRAQVELAKYDPYR